ncbi:MAG: hypothetical protein AAF441_26960, partial [Pseudomonadota bacterium]
VDQIKDRDLKRDGLKAQDILFRNRSGWSLPEGARTSVTSCAGFVFYGKVVVAPTKRTKKPAPVSSAIAVGNSTQEAICALLANKHSPGNPGPLEERLEAVRFDVELKDDVLDFTAKLREVRHAAGFTETAAQKVWAIRPAKAAVSDASKATSPTTLTPGDQGKIQLPQDIAHGLDELNRAQFKFDCAHDELRSLRQRLFSDWFIYMLAMYPPDSEDEFEIDVDQMRDAVLQDSIRDFDRKLTQTGDMDAPVAGTLAFDLVQLQTLVENLLKAFNAGREKNQALELAPNRGPRYWQPNDPVLALDRARALAPSQRHAQDGRARKDKMLECIVADLGAFPGHETPTKDILAFRRAVVRRATKPFRMISDREQGARSWNPILLEWLASVASLEAGSNLTGSRRRYSEDFILRNHKLAEDQTEFQFAGNKAPDMFGRRYITSGRTILTSHGTTLLEKSLKQYAARLSSQGVEMPQDLGSIYEGLHLSQRRGPADGIISLSLGGLNERMLMKRLEAQLPISDPLGFAPDQAIAAEVRRRVGPLTDLYSPDPGSPFLPLRSAELQILPGRVIDSFGQTVDWTPLQGDDGGPNQVYPAQTLRDGVSDRIIMPPRCAQPARLDFRWLSNERDDVESNDHPATTPLCGWLVPNDFDQDILVYDAAGLLLGTIGQNGQWRPAPGSDDAPAGPGLIGNRHLARVVSWLVSRPDPGFIGKFLSTLDSSLRMIDPTDYTTQGSRALLVGRPVAIARARVGLSLQGPPATDRSMSATALRMAGLENDDHGFGEVKLPIRIGEHGQLNDGLIGYFVDGSEITPPDVLQAPQASTASSSRHIRVYDEANQVPLNLQRSFSDPPLDLIMLLDPRCPVHATTGILPTKAITIPREQFAASLRDMELVFSGMPILTPPDAVHLPLPSEPDHRWSWLEMRDGNWREVPADPVFAKDALARAYPGRVAEKAGGAIRQLAAGERAGQGETERPRAELIWERLLSHGWIEPMADGRAKLLAPKDTAPRTLGPGVDAGDIERGLSKIAETIKPMEREAVFAARPVVREGWLKLKPVAGPKPVPLQPPPNQTKTS